MDPNAALQRLLDAIRDGALEEVREASDALQRWLDGGGFAPEMDGEALALLCGAMCELANLADCEGLSWRRS